MSTPSSKAYHCTSSIECKTIPEAWAELDADPRADSLVVFFVSVKYHSPTQPFSACGRSEHQEHEDSVDTVLAWLRGGVAPDAAGKKLRRMQRWEWGAIAVDLSSLAAELESRYELSEAEPETDLDYHRIPGGIVVTCEVILRALEF